MNDSFIRCLRVNYVTCSVKLFLTLSGKRWNKTINFDEIKFLL